MNIILGLLIIEMFWSYVVRQQQMIICTMYCNMSMGESRISYICQIRLIYIKSVFQIKKKNLGARKLQIVNEFDEQNLLLFIGDSLNVMWICLKLISKIDSKV